MTVHVSSLLGQTDGGDGCFPEERLGEKEGAWQYLEEQLVLIRDQRSLLFCEIRNNFTLPLVFIRPYYK